MASEVGLRSARHPHPRTGCRRAAWLLPLAGLTALALGGCGGASSGSAKPASTSDGTNVPLQNVAGGCASQPAAPATDQRPTTTEAARFLTQATFGIQSLGEVENLRNTGFERWLCTQFAQTTASQVAYLDQQSLRNPDGDGKPYASEEMSYEAVWQQWLKGPDQLRARTTFALAEIFVISNVAPDIRPYAMSSYMDMLNRNAFGNYRTLLKEVTLHPAMGYYLNLLQSEKANPDTGSHPNENYAREVLQLFSIGLVKLNLDGTPVKVNNATVPTYDESVVQGFAQAFSGWSYANATNFYDADENAKAAWTTPMKPFAGFHSTGPKKLLNGTVLPGGGSPESDLDAALDNIFNHPNVGPFIGRQLIQRLVTSNPSPAYISRVASVFNDDGSTQHVRGNLQAVVRAVLLDPEARDATAAAASTTFGKLREPVIRFANLLRGMNASSASGLNNIHYLDGADDGLGQSPLLAPSVFNFFSPNYKHPGAIAANGLVAPEFQITTETTVAGSLNFFVDTINQGGYGWDDRELKFNFTPYTDAASDPAQLVGRINTIFFTNQMSASTRSRMLTMLQAMPADDDWSKQQRVRAALTLTFVSPDFVVQK